MTGVHLGDYREVFRNLERVDAVIADPPYGGRTHDGHDTGANLANKVSAIVKANGVQDTMRERRSLSYAAWGQEDVRECVEFWAPRCPDGWMAFMSCSDLASVRRAEMTRVGRYAFHPLPCVTPGMTVRMSGDGPSSWAVYLNVSRPRSKAFVGKKSRRGGTRPGAYVVKRGLRARTSAAVGGKPLQLMRSIVSDYTLPGDLVADPCAGYGTTGVAALRLGRRFVGAEVKQDMHAVAAQQILEALKGEST